MSTLWTIGHSTRPMEEFLGLLKAHGIRRVADVRLIPYSKRNPQFNSEALGSRLKQAGLQYKPLPALGGRRRARPDSPNQGWRSAGFRGYADYMQTPAFRQALLVLMALAEDGPTAVLCAEAVPWRCHRTLIADALVVRGWTVRHILASTRADPHQLTPFAQWKDGILSYPGPSERDSVPRLF